MKFLPMVDLCGQLVVAAKRELAGAHRHMMGSYRSTVVRNVYSRFTCACDGLSQAVFPTQLSRSQQGSSEWRIMIE